MGMGGEQSLLVLSGRWAIAVSPDLAELPFFPLNYSRLKAGQNTGSQPVGIKAYGPSISNHITIQEKTGFKGDRDESSVLSSKTRM